MTLARVIDGQATIATVYSKVVQMNDSVAKPGQMVEVGPLGKSLQAQQQTLLIRTHGVEIVQLVIPAGEQVPTHEAQGEIILHCLEGHVTLAVGGQSREL